MKQSHRLTILSALAVVALASCGGGESPTPISSVDQEALNQALTLAKQTVAFSGSLTSIYLEDGDSYNEGDIDLTIADGFAEWKKTFVDSSNYDVTYDYTFTKNEAGHVSYDRLTLLNQVENVEYVAPRDTSVTGSKAGPLDYDAVLSNPFANLEADDFQLIEGRYYLKNHEEDFEGMMTLCSISQYHIYPSGISSVSFSLNNGRFQDAIITTEPREDGLLDPKDFFFDASFRLVFPGEIEKSTISPKAHREEHDTLKTALEGLQQTISGGNYTVVAKDEESGGEYGGTYNNYATEDGFYSDFRAALDQYKIGYSKGEDGAYYRYKHYVSGTNMGKVEYYTEKTSKRWKQTREDLEMNFLAFAPEFFLKGKNNVFSTTNGDVVDAIRQWISPFYDRQDDYYVGTKVFFNLNESNEITSWGCVARDPYGGYEDTFTYTLDKVGTTKLTTLPAQE